MERYLTSKSTNVSRTVRAGVWTFWLLAMIFLTYAVWIRKGPPSATEVALTQLIPNGYLLFLLIWILPGTLLWQVLRLGEGLGLGLSIGIGALASLTGFVIGVPAFGIIVYVGANLMYEFTH